MLKKFLIGTFVALALMVASTAAASYDFGPTTLKVGSKGDYVKTLQTLVGANADGNFGPMTKAKVQAWQAANGLVADGLFGNLSKAKANLGLGGSVSGNFPAGCTSASGFSPTTGQACVAIPSTVAGCQSGALFSSTTGQSCTGTVVTPGVLAGTAGEIATLTQLSQYSSEEVGAGQKDIKVLGIEMKASKDGDIGINSMKVSFVITNASGSTRLTDYANAVTIWQGTTKVGSSLAADFNKDSTGNYSKTISLSNSVVKADATEKFYVTVDALSSFDSADIDSEAMTIGIDNVRYVDGSGVTTTEAGTGDLPISGVTVAFVSYSTAADTELKITTSSSSPKAQVSKVSTTANTDDVVLLKGTLKLTGTSNVWLDELPIALTSTGGDIQALTGSLKLVLGSNTYTESVATASTSGTITFNNLNYTITAGSTVDFTVSADMNDIEDSGVAATDFDEGDTLTASLTATNRAAMVVENSQGDSLTDATERTGSAVGEAITFRSEGVNVVMGTVTYDNTEDTSGNVTTVTYTIPVSVTSFGDTLYMGQSVQLAAAATASNAFAVVFQNSTAPTVSDVAATASFTLATSNATIETNGFRLDDGVTKNFTITVVLTTPTTGSNSYRVALKQLQTFTDANLGLGSTLNSLTPVESYQTGYKFITS
jgi:peptidoglycan hydrolase-like protein with peptidoglycan-binding domain